MKKVIFIYLIVPVLTLVCVVCSKEEKQVSTNPASTITLRWVRAHENETRHKVETGFKWALLFLGSELKHGSFDNSVIWKSDDMLEVDFQKLDFSAEGLQALTKLIAEMKKSGEYTEKGGIDIGRFIVLTVNSPHHYYAITNAPKTLDDFRNRLSFDNKKAGIVESNIAKGHRIIEIPDLNSTDILKSAFISSEGAGLITDNSFKVTEYEVFDIMPNGMFRFMLYDQNGILKPAGDISLGGAGKPSNCLWCHESGIQPAFISRTQVNGYYTPDEYEEIIKNRFELLKTYRENMKQDIDYDREFDHTFMEILYISFMEPSAERLASEWGISAEQVKEQLKELPVHTHNEFRYLGILYDRRDVEKMSPYSVIKTPESAREVSEYEPNLIK